MMTYGDHWTSLRRAYEAATATGFYNTILAAPDPDGLPDKDIVPDETRPLEDEPVKTDQVPEE